MRFVVGAGAFFTACDTGLAHNYARNTSDEPVLITTGGCQPDKRGIDGERSGDAVSYLWARSVNSDSAQYREEVYLYNMK